MKNLEATLAQLIAIRTVSSTRPEAKEEGKRANKAAMDWVVRELSKLPIKVFSRYIKTNGQPMLLITTRKTNSPEILFYVHMDVVPASDEMFKAKKKGAYLYGRGAYDMKFALACYLKLLAELGEDLPKYDFGILITSDEEIGGDSVPIALKKIKPKICVMPDGGKHGELDRTVKGMMQITVTSKGISTHASTPWKGRNAINQLMAFLQDVQKEFSFRNVRKGKHKHNTLNIGTFQAGSTTNQVPGLAKATIDIRFIPNTTKADLKSVIRDVLKNHPSITTKVTFADASFVIDQQNEYVRRFKAIASKVLKCKMTSGISHGSSDATYFVARGIPVISTRPLGGGLHGEKERVNLRDLRKFYQILKEFATS